MKKLIVLILYLILFVSCANVTNSEIDNEDIYFDVGIIEDGEFISKGINIIPNLETEIHIKHAAEDDYFARVLILKTPDKKFFNKDTVYGDFKRVGGKEGVRIYLFNVNVNDTIATFLSMISDEKGKPTIFSNNMQLQGDYKYAYVIYCLPHDKFTISFPNEQFESHACT